MIDSSGQKTSTSTVITVGNTSPTVVVEAPLDGGTFSFGDKIQYKVTVTDPEDPSINCNDVQVTFVLGHDTHGHAEAGTTGCTGFLQTDAGDVAHGGNVFGVISASYTDKGGQGANSAAPPLMTTSQVQIRQKHQEVEFVVNQLGTATATNTDVPGTGVHRSAITAGDWLQLNGPFNLFQIGTVAIRYADGTAGRTVGSPLVGIDIRQDSITGPVIATADLTSTGGVGVWATHHRADLHDRQARGVRHVPAAHGRPDGRQHDQPELAGVRRQRRHRPADQHHRSRLAAPCRRRCRCRSARRRPSGRSPPGVAKTYNAATTANVISIRG